MIAPVVAGTDYPIDIYQEYFLPVPYLDGSHGAGRDITNVGHSYKF